LAPLRFCQARRESQANNVGLGDYTEQLLASLGVTKDRYIAAKEMFGLAPTCGCNDRKSWLNKVSEWWRGESLNPPQPPQKEQQTGPDQH
jgi:hypothetical protein